jgi:ADP-L-glycero-D-manno-heptose 6-epimerase
MIVVTGAAGFIGSCLVRALNDAGLDDLILVDQINKAGKEENLQGKRCHEFMDRDDFLAWFEKHAVEVDFVFHLGAKTDTTLFDVELFDRLNLHYSQSIWNTCSKFGIPMLYASSAATYGDGELGYKDDHSLIPHLKPLNPYGQSKQDFDVWVLQQSEQPPFWAGLKFFNVYGPNEYHKGRMASVIMHAFNQIKEHGSLKLFRSHKPEYSDGGQLRDFVYVKDVVEVMKFLFDKRPDSAIYNLGSGKARSFIDLANAVFHEMQITPNIEFIDTPEDIREKYQYYTQADMSKLISVGYEQPFHSLEEGVADYVGQYLDGRCYL